ncbi:hypothetical protein D3C85_633950 [compost metagenome]
MFGGTGGGRGLLAAQLVQRGGIAVERTLGAGHLALQAILLGAKGIGGNAGLTGLLLQLALGLAQAIQLAAGAAGVALGFAQRGLQPLGVRRGVQLAAQAGNVVLRFVVGTGSALDDGAGLVELIGQLGGAFGATESLLQLLAGFAQSVEGGGALAGLAGQHVLAA